MNRLQTLKDIKAEKKEKSSSKENEMVAMPRPASVRALRRGQLSNSRNRIDVRRPVERYLKGKSNIWVKKRS